MTLAELFELETAATTAGLIYLTKADAATIAHVTTRTIERWIATGYLRAGGSPGLVLIKPEWLEEALERRRNGREDD